ncbi:MAG: oxidoreductase [Opitutales bacterium]|nr:oxidoreductase [Opitutales bacterium]
MTNDRKCRWGILGSAGIAQKNWQAMAHAENAELVAVASRDQAKAREFIERCAAQVPLAQAPDAVGGYDELLARDDVDAIYLPLPTGLRTEWALKVAQAGKHLLCEKPCGTSLEEVERMVEACERAGVQFMDGVMFMHSDRLAKVREVMEDERTIGDLRRIATQFSFWAPEDFLTQNIRMHSDLEPHGCLGDLGWYAIRFILWAMKYQEPKAVTGRLLNASGRSDSPHPVPTEFSGELLFDGVSASFYCSFLTEHQQFAHLSGSKGNLRIDDFVLPYFGNRLGFVSSNARFDCEVCDFRMERREAHHQVDEYASSHSTAQETKLFRTFSGLVLKGETDPHWPQITLLTQRLMMACMESAQKQGKEITID